MKETMKPSCFCNIYLAKVVCCNPHKFFIMRVLWCGPHYPYKPNKAPWISVWCHYDVQTVKNRKLKWQSLFLTLKKILGIPDFHRVCGKKKILEWIVKHEKQKQNKMKKKNIFLFVIAWVAPTPTLCTHFWRTSLPPVRVVGTFS